MGKEMEKENVEFVIRIIGPTQTDVAWALKRLEKIFDTVVITGIKRAEIEGEWRGYAFCCIQKKTETNQKDRGHG